MDPQHELDTAQWHDDWHDEVERVQHAHRDDPRAMLDAVDALVVRWDDELQAESSAILRAVDARAGDSLEALKAAITDDENRKLSQIRSQRIQIHAAARRVDDARRRLVEPPDGEPYLLPPGHTFGGFSPDGKVISGVSSVEIHTPTEQPYRWKNAAAASTTRSRRRGQVRQRRGSSGRPRARRAARRAAGVRAGPDDGPSEPPALALADPPKPTYNFAVSRCPDCGGVLLWADGRLVCASRSCPRWGRPA